MGILLAVAAEIAVSTIAAVTEAAAEAAISVTTAGFSEETAVLGEIAVEAAAEDAAEEAAAGVVVDVGGDIEIITQKCLFFIAKFNKMIKEFCAIDAVFKAAGELLHNCSTPNTCDKSERLNKSLDILHKLQTKMTDVNNWLEEHKGDAMTLEGFEVPLDSALLKKVLKPLSMALGSLEKLTADVSKLNMNNQVISNAQIVSFDRSMIRIVATFHELAAFKEEKSDKIPILNSFPITMEEVNKWKDQLGFVDDVFDGLCVLNTERYKYPEYVSNAK